MLDQKRLGKYTGTSVPPGSASAGFRHLGLFVVWSGLSFVHFDSADSCQNCVP